MHWFCNIGRRIINNHGFPFADFLAGITVYENNIVLINDLDKFLSLDDELALDEALNGGAF